MLHTLMTPSAEDEVVFAGMIGQAARCYFRSLMSICRTLHSAKKSVIV